jgi:hypothetical protein
MKHICSATVRHMVRACSGLGAEAALLRLEAASSSSVCYLGPHRVAFVAGLRIAAYDSLRAPSGAALVKEVNSTDGDIDLLLTCDWPEHVLTGTPPVQGVRAGSCTVTLDLVRVHTTRTFGSASCAAQHACQSRLFPVAMPP